MATQYRSMFRKALGIGARSVAIFASCHGTAADGVTPLRQRITDLAKSTTVSGVAAGGEAGKPGE